MVLVKKYNDDIRICLDPRDLNKAIRRPHYHLPTIDDILPKLHKAKFFTLLDAKSGFWQVKLDEKSSFLTTFNTPFGRFRWLRMPFGICSASEEYQRRMMQALEGLDGIAIVADDILVYGCGDSREEAEKQHDDNLVKLLEACRKQNLKLNKEKVRYKSQEIKFIGHIVSDKGIKPDSEKVQAVINMKSPCNIKELKTFMGMINYVGKFIPNISKHTKTLRTLEKKDTVW